MRESILLMNFKGKKQLKGIQMTAFLLKLKIRMVEEKDFLQPLGYLAGVEGIEPSDEVFQGEAPEHEILVFAGVPDAKLQRMLAEMRKNGIKKVDHKAILTPTNVHWNTIELYEELDKEHQAIQKGQQAHEGSSPEENA